MLEVAIGIDIGGTHLSAVAVDRNIKALFTNTCASSQGTGCCVLKNLILCKAHRKVTDRSVQPIVDIIVDMMCDIHAQLTATQGDKPFTIIGVGMGVPGNVDPEAGLTRYLPNFAWHTPVPLRDMILERLDATWFDKEKLKIELRNDARCAALSEAAFGSGIGSKVFALLTLGTGIGGALVIQGSLFDGCSYDAGDFGHHVIRSGADAWDCICGKKGCFEKHASALGLITHYTLLCAVVAEHQVQCRADLTRASVEAASAAVAADNASTAEEALAAAAEASEIASAEADAALSADASTQATGHNALSILLKMRAGDPTATKAWVNYCDDLSSGLANLVTFYNPDVIALGGGLGQAEELYAGDLMSKLVDGKSLPASRGCIRVVPAGLGTESGAVGAALLVT